MYVDVRMSFLTLMHFCVSSVFDPIPKFTKQILLTHITLVELFTALNSFAGAVKTQKLTRVPFLFKVVAVVS